MTESVPVVTGGGGLERLFPFRPWVRRAGFSILAVAALATTALIAALIFSPQTRWSWGREATPWVYLGALWIGGARVYFGTFRPVVEIRKGLLVIRPLHGFRTRSILWSHISGTEQTIGGDRLIVYYETGKGLRFVALNLNLIRGRKEFVELLSSRLLASGFDEHVLGNSRFLRRETSS